MVLLSYFIGHKYDPKTDIPKLNGKVILVTGGNSGLGEESCLQLAYHEPAHIFLAARNKSAADASISQIKTAVPNASITFLELDLTSFASIQNAVKTFTSQSDRLDILMNNAGIMATSPGLTKDGYELQFGTNHMGHALLTKLLMPTLQNTARQQGANSDVRIINLSSAGHMMTRNGIPFEDLKTDMATYNTWTRYGVSKLSNILFSNELARRYPEIKSISLHPGSVNTGLSRGLKTTYPWAAWIIQGLLNLVTTTVQQGTMNQLWASTSDKVVNGEYYDPVGVVGRKSKFVNDEGLAKKLWEFTETEFEAHGV